MFFSVIIPLYNKVEVIERTLNSVAEQTFNDYELIVVDDGSTDGSTERVREFAHSEKWRNTGCELRLFCQQNSGPSSARNRGARDAKGRFLTMLDGDDVWLPFHLSDLYKVYERYPDAKVLSTGTASVEAGKVVNRARQKVGISRFNIFDFPRGNYPLCSDTLTIDREYFSSVGGYDSRYHYFEDRAFYYKLAEDIGDFYVNWRVSALYYHDAKNSAHTTGRRSYLEYGFLQYANGEILAGRASARMKRCVASSVNHFLRGEVVRGRWESVQEMEEAFPMILGLLCKHRWFNWRQHKLSLFIWYSVEWVAIHLKNSVEKIF